MHRGAQISLSVVLPADVHLDDRATLINQITTTPLVKRLTISVPEDLYSFINRVRGELLSKHTEYSKNALLLRLARLGVLYCLINMEAKEIESLAKEVAEGKIYEVFIEHADKTAKKVAEAIYAMDCILETISIESDKELIESIKRAKEQPPKRDFEEFAYNLGVVA